MPEVYCTAKKSKPKTVPRSFDATTNWRVKVSRSSRIAFETQPPFFGQPAPAREEKAEAPAGQEETGPTAEACQSSGSASREAAKAQDGAGHSGEEEAGAGKAVARSSRSVISVRSDRACFAS